MGSTGKNSYLLEGKETTFGTPVSATKDFGLIQSKNPQYNKNISEHHGLGSSSVQQTVEGIFEATNTTVIKVQHGRIFEAIFGAVAHDDSDTPDIKHTFTEADTTPIYSIEYGLSATRKVTMTSAAVNSATISIALNGVLEVSVDWRAQTCVSATSPSAAVLSTLPLLSALQSTLKVGTQSSEAAIAEVQDFSLTITKVLEYQAGLGVEVAQQGEHQKFSYEGRFTAGFDDEAEFERFLGGASPTAVTPFSMVLDATNGVALASGRRQFFMDLAGVRYKTAGQTINIDGFIIQEFTVSATGIDSCYYYDNIVAGSF